MFHTDSIRNGCKDIWNVYMCGGVAYGHCDIPYCLTTAVASPNRVITWSEAKAIYKRQNAIGNHDLLEDTFVCLYEDDYKFDGQRGIWHDSDYTLKVLHHFAGVITPDFSTYQDFPEPLNIYNTYRMRAYGYWLGRNGIAVINNVW